MARRAVRCGAYAAVARYVRSDASLQRAARMRCCRLMHALTPSGSHPPVHSARPDPRGERSELRYVTSRIAATPPFCLRLFTMLMRELTYHA